MNKMKEDLVGDFLESVLNKCKEEVIEQTKGIETFE